MEKEVYKLINMQDVEAVEIEWLWKPYIPLGKLTIIQGDGGEGKTTFILRVASMMSKGEFFDMDGNVEQREPIHVIYQTAEDGLADTVKPRLLESGADCTKINVIDESSKGLNMIDDRIERAIIETNAKMLILDPIQAYLGSKLDMNRANDVREATKTLGGIAEHTGCAIVLIGHMNKGSGVKAAYRGIGSVDFFAVARSVLLIGKMPKDDTKRVVCQIKNNLALKGESLSFSLTEDGFKWTGFCDVTEDEILTGIKADTKTSKACTFISEILEKNGTYPSNEIFEKGKALGISKRTIGNAKQELGIKSFKEGNQWFWKL